MIPERRCLVMLVLDPGSTMEQGLLDFAD